MERTCGVAPRLWGHTRRSGSAPGLRRGCDRGGTRAALLGLRPVLVVIDASGESQVEPLRGYAIRSIQDRGEHDPLLVAAVEEAEQRRLLMVCAETMEELGVGGEASPALADCGDAR